MKLRSKLLFSLVAGALAVPLAFAQGTTPAPDDAQAPNQEQGGPAGPGGPPPGRRMGPPRDGRGQGNGEGRGWGRSEGRERREGWGGRPGRHGREFGLARLVENPAMRERLGITAEQADKIRRETDDFRKGQIRARADLQIRALELRELMRGDSPDRAAIDKKMDEISAARAVQAKAAMHYRLDMRSVLTAEQREKLRGMMEQRGRRGPTGGPGGPPRGPRSHDGEDDSD